MPHTTHETVTISPEGSDVSWRRPMAEFEIETTTIHADEPDGQSHILLQLGMGNEGLRVRMAVAKRLGELGVEGVTIVDALPYWMAEVNSDSVKTSTNLTTFAARTIDSIAASLKDELGVETLHGLGESQGSVAMLQSMRSPDSPLNGRLGLIHPLGLTPGVLTTPRFLSRMLQTGLQLDNLREPIAATVGFHAGQRAASDVMRTRRRQIKAALEYDGTPTMSEILASGRDTGVFVGQNDRLFPPSEIEAHLQARGIKGYTFEIGEGPHASVATRVGAKLAARACYWAETGLLLPEECIFRRIICATFRSNIVILIPLPHSCYT